MSEKDSPDDIDWLRVTIAGVIIAMFTVFVIQSCIILVKDSQKPGVPAVSTRRFVSDKDVGRGAQ